MHPAPSESEGTEASVRIGPWRGTSSDTKSGCNVRSTLRPDSRLFFCALGALSIIFADDTVSTR